MANFLQKIRFDKLQLNSLARREQKIGLSQPHRMFKNVAKFFMKME